jgi:AraC family transcriptional regulator
MIDKLLALMVDVNEAKRLLPAARFIKANYSRNPSLGEIAATVHLSPFHFHRIFRRVFGVTPHQVTTECQIEQAKKLIAQRLTPLAEIAAACGFAHQSHFCSRFKQMTGMSPVKWLRMHKAQKAA